MARIDQVLAGEKSWGKYALDVLGHAGLGAAYSLPIVAFVVLRLDWDLVQAIWAGLVFALFGGIVREIVQYVGSGKLHIEDRVLDVLHHVLGPPIAWGLVKLFAVLFN